MYRETITDRGGERCQPFGHVSFQILHGHQSAQGGQVIEKHASCLARVEIFWISRDSLQGVGESQTIISIAFLVNLGSRWVDEDFTRARVIHYGHAPLMKGICQGFGYLDA